jgi:hypothetical protein
MHRPGIEPGASRNCPSEWMATANFTTKPPMQKRSLRKLDVVT